MMKVILTSFGSFGDIYPFLWMAEVLQRKGISTGMITNSIFKDVVEKKNVRFIGIGCSESYTKFFDSIDVTKQKNLFSSMKDMKAFVNEMILGLVEETYTAISDNCNQDTILINSVFAFGAKLASVNLNVKQYTVVLSPINIDFFNDESKLNNIVMGFINRAAFNSLYGKPLRKIAQDMGLSKGMDYSYNSLFSSPTLCLFPEWFQNFIIERNHNILNMGFPDIVSNADLPQDLKIFLKEHPEPIVFTPGTPFRNSTRFFDEALKAIEELNLPAIFLTKNPASIPQGLPKTVYQSDFLPLDKVLPLASMIVHHGGIGTVNQAARSGIPQVIYFHPGLDQKRNASLLVHRSIAKIAPYSKLTSTLIIKHVKELQKEPVGKKCKDLAVSINEHNSEQCLIKALGL